jgi:hypothetical protein
LGFMAERVGRSGWSRICVEPEFDLSMVPACGMMCYVRVQRDEQAMAEWRERWEGVALCTKPVDRQKAESGISNLYRMFGAGEPKFLWFDSPLELVLSEVSWELGEPGSCLSPTAQWRLAPGSYDETVLTRLEREREVRQKGVRALKRQWPGGRVGKEALLSGLMLKKPVYSHMGRKDFPAAPLSVKDSIAAATERALHDWVYVRSAESYCTFAFWHGGQHEVSWIAHCQWARDAEGYGFRAEENEMLDAWIAIAESCGWWLPLEYGCLVCERPERIEVSGAGLPHCAVGPAVRFRDSFAVWALNGVAVPQWLVEMPAEEMDPGRVTQISDAGIRGEFVKKVGVERICSALNAKCADKEGDCELLLLEGGDGRGHPFLKMPDTSSGGWHMEAVEASCRTVREGLRRVIRVRFQR